MISMILFSLISALSTYFIIRHYEKIDRAELASYVTILVWVAFLFGISAGRIAAPIFAAGLAR